jgi:hypothetical protein
MIRRIRRESSRRPLLGGVLLAIGGLVLFAFAVYVTPMEPKPKATGVGIATALAAGLCLVAGLAACSVGLFRRTLSDPNASAQGTRVRIGQTLAQQVGPGSVIA